MSRFEVELRVLILVCLALRKEKGRLACDQSHGRSKKSDGSRAAAREPTLFFQRQFPPAAILWRNSKSPAMNNTSSVASCQVLFIAGDLWPRSGTPVAAFKPRPSVLHGCRYFSVAAFRRRVDLPGEPAGAVEIPQWGISTAPFRPPD